MVDLGYQDTDCVDGNVKDILDANFLRDGQILATFSMGKGKCGYLGCISGWFGTLKRTPRARDG